MNYCMSCLDNAEHKTCDLMGKLFDEYFELLVCKRVKEIGVGNDGDVIEGGMRNGLKNYGVL